MFIDIMLIGATTISLSLITSIVIANVAGNNIVLKLGKNGYYLTSNKVLDDYGQVFDKGYELKIPKALENIWGFIPIINIINVLKYSKRFDEGVVPYLEEHGALGKMSIEEKAKFDSLDNDGKLNFMNNLLSRSERNRKKAQVKEKTVVEDKTKTEDIPVIQVEQKQAEKGTNEFPHIVFPDEKQKKLEKCYPAYRKMQKNNNDTRK